MAKTSIQIYPSYRALPDSVREALKQANLFYSAQYEQFIRSQGSRPVYLTDGAYVLVVTLHTMRRFFTSAMMLSEPFALTGAGDFDSVQHFLDAVMDALKGLRADWLLTTATCALFSAYPNNSERIRFGNYITDLTLSDEALFQAFDSKHRNMVRRGEKGGVMVKIGGRELLEDYMLLDKQTWDRSHWNKDNRSIYTSYLELMPEQTVVGIAYQDGVPQCGIFGLYNTAMFYYMYGATADKPEPGATHFLQWEMMRFLKRKGVKAYNFVGYRIDADEGSKFQHIQHFKKGFGGTLIDCYLFRAVFNKPKKKLFDVALELLEHRNLKDVIDQEIHKWADINGTDAVSMKKRN